MKDRFGRPLEKVAVHDEELVLGRRKYRFVTTLGVGKSAVSSLYRAEVGDDCVTLKKFQTRGDNQILHSQALDFELASYERMASSGILVPRLRGYDRDSYVLVKDYITGQVQIDVVAANAVEPETHRQLFALAGQLRRGGWSPRLTSWFGGMVTWPSRHAGGSLRRPRGGDAILAEIDRVVVSKE